MSFVWLPATALELGNQADHQLYWKPKQQVSPWFLLFFFSTWTHCQFPNVKGLWQQSLSLAGLLIYLSGTLTCGSYVFLTAHLQYWMRGMLEHDLELPHAFLSSSRSPGPAIKAGAGPYFVMSPKIPMPEHKLSFKQLWSNFCFLPIITTFIHCSGTWIENDKASSLAYPSTST